MVKDINLDIVTPLRSLSSINEDEDEDEDEDEYDDMYAGAIPANNNIENYYELVGLMFGKYITQDLEKLLSFGEVQYAKDYIPIGKFMALLILKGIFKIKPEDENPFPIPKKMGYKMIAFDQNIDNNNVDTKLNEQLEHGENTESQKTIIEGIIGHEDNEPLESEQILYLLMKFYGNNEEESMKYFESFFKGVKKMIKVIDFLHPNKLIEIFECNPENEKNKFLKLLELEKNKFEQEPTKLQYLESFISIINEKDANELKEIFKFFSGQECCPSNVRIDFGYGSLFMAHMCSNGLDLPNPEKVSVGELKDALAKTLEFKDMR